MKPYTLPPLTRGLDVVTPEGSLAEGAVRRASNIQLLDDGGFQMRPGYTLLGAHAGLHSLWKSPAQTRVFGAIADTVYEVDVATGGVAALFSGLQPGEPVSYEDVGPDVYVVSPGIARRVAPDGTVTRPGVADLFGSAPTVTSTVGGLYPGRYGVAYSLVTATGEESPMSSIAWITLAAIGGILLTGLQSATDAVDVRLYVTAPGGDELYHHATRTYAASQSITDQTRQRLATRQGLMPLPGGTIVRLHNGSLYVVDGKTIWRTRPLDYGVVGHKDGWLTFNRTVTMLEPVEGGIFIGLRERTIFLRSDGVQWIQHNAAHGALPLSSCKVAPDYFSPELVPDRDTPVATWLTESGLAIGRADGSVSFPQADRIRITGGVSRPLFTQVGGIKQGVFCVESMATGPGGATDLTI